MSTTTEQQHQPHYTVESPDSSPGSPDAFVNHRMQVASGHIAGTNATWNASWFCGPYSSVFKIEMNASTTSPQRFETLRAGRASLQVESDSETEEHKIACSGKAAAEKQSPNLRKKRHLDSFDLDLPKGDDDAADPQTQPSKKSGATNSNMSVCHYVSDSQTTVKMTEGEAEQRLKELMVPPPSSPKASLKANWSCMTRSPMAETAEHPVKAPMTSPPKGPLKANWSCMTWSP